MSEILQQIRARMGDYIGRDMDRSLGAERLTPAGVLVPIFLKDGELTILLTKRASDMKEHRGEVSFPGGRYDEEDGSLLACALRETHEEIGVPPEQVEPIGRLDETPVITNYRITPYVGVIPFPFDFVPNPDEIEKLIFAPISALTDPSCYWMTLSQWAGRPFPMHYYNLHGEVVWGATGRILTHFLDLCCDYVPPTYAAFLEETRDPRLIR